MEFVVLLLIFGFLTHRLDRRLKAQEAEIATLRGRLDKALAGAAPLQASPSAEAEAAAME